LETLQEERCGEAEHEVGQVIRMQEEVELLQNALRDIAHAVIQDAESRDAEQPHAATHLHLTPAGPVPQRSVSSSLQFHFVQTMEPFGHEK
jgi:rootletin